MELAETRTRRVDDVPVRLGLKIVAGLAVTGLLVALLTSELQCPPVPGANEELSGYCELADFPGMPDSAGSLILVVTVYLGPALLVALGLFTSWRTENTMFLGIGLAAACVLVLVMLALVVAANAHYAGTPAPGGGHH